MAIYYENIDISENIKQGADSIDVYQGDELLSAPPAPKTRTVIVHYNNAVYSQYDIPIGSNVYDSVNPANIPSPANEFRVNIGFTTIKDSTTGINPIIVEQGEEPLDIYVISTIPTYIGETVPGSTGLTNLTGCTDPDGDRWVSVTSAPTIRMNRGGQFFSPGSYTIYPTFPSSRPYPGVLNIAFECGYLGEKKVIDGASRITLNASGLQNRPYYIVAELGTNEPTVCATGIKVTGYFIYSDARTTLGGGQ